MSSQAGRADARSVSDLGTALRSGASVLALCALAAATPAFARAQQGAGNLEGTAGQAQGSDDAQAPETRISDSTDPATSTAEGEEIVVTGIRQSLANAQNIKRNADTVVDAITAQDIGALPDRSVTEALQRVPGVAINRFAGSNDPDHFSVEGSGVVVRGLSFVRSEFNGRDTFSTGVYGQAINFSDVPAELLGSVEVYKNATAEMIEGGLSGTVNLNLRLPFDRRGLHGGFDVEVNYSDLAEKYSPVGSFLVSNTWDTDAGTFGLLGAFAYSQVFSRADGIQVTNFQLRNGSISTVNAPGAGNALCRTRLPSDTNTSALPPPNTCGEAGTGGPDGFADLLGAAYAPLGGQFRTQDYDRERTGLAFAAQWESTDRRALLTAQFLRSHARTQWGEHTFESAPDLSEYNTFPAGCVQNTNAPGGRTRAECPVGDFENYQYDENGVFESGFITLPGTGWRTASSGNPATRVPTGGIQQSLSRRQVDDVNVVQDHGLNFKFAPTERWAINLDAQYVKARHDNLDVSIFGSRFADQELDLTGDIPVVIPHKPLTLAANWAAPNPTMAAQTDEQYFQDPQWTFWRAAMDHTERSRGEEWAFKGDVSYNFEDDIPFLRRVKFGARYSDRDQKIRFTSYNWGVLSEVWSGSSPVFMDQFGTDRVEFFEFDNFFRGQTPGPVGGHYYGLDLIEGYGTATDFFKSVAEEWRERGAGASTWLPLAERPGVVAGTPFLPSEQQDVSEENKAAYVMLSFGQDDPVFGDVTVDGNIGVRYVNTRVDSSGLIGVPTRQALGVATPFAERCREQVPEGAPPGTPPSRPGGVCNVGAEGYAQLQQFATGEVAANVAVSKYDYFLPSLNVKFGLTETLIARFAASRALARPALADIRNFVTIGSDASAGFQLTATAGNPFLKPALSDQFDASLEWYFRPGGVGSLTLNGFYKKIHNFFFQDVIEREITSNGVTQSVFVRGPANFEGSGTVKGFELAYQQTYDFLPSFLSGLGVNASYTFISSKGLPNSRLNLGGPAGESPIGVAGNLPLEQLSKHNVNVAAFYEKGPISLRAAYNWRSRFLLTSADVIFPFFPVFNDDTGQLDASIFYSVTPKIKLGVQAVNLTNEVTKTLQQFTTDGLLGPRSYFMNDRRFSFILRGSF